MENYIEDNRIHEGHRQRMRAKLLEHGQRIFDTYELLEMLLYHVIPYKDTNPISKRLLAAFGSLDGVLSASRDELIGVSGVGERTADFLIQVADMSSILGAEFMPMLHDDFTDCDRAGEYLANYLKDEKGNAVVAMLLDNNMRLIEVKKLFDNDYESGAIRPKNFIDAAISANASVVISAHNHPCGPCYPTPADRVTNSLISDSLAVAGILHAEHYVVSGDMYVPLGSAKGIVSRLNQTSAAKKFISSIPESAFADNPEQDLTYPPADARYHTRNFNYLASLLAPVEGKNARKTAHLLFNKFLTIENMLCASEETLISMFSEKVAFFVKLLGYVTSRRATDSFSCGKLYTKAEIADYLKSLFIGDSVEKVYLLTFDGRGRFTGCDMLGEGTVNSTEVLPRKAIEVAIKKRAKSVSIAHNHPLGKPDLSTEDRKFTGTFAGLFSSCEINFVDHYVVAGQLCSITTVGVMKTDERC